MSKAFDVFLFRRDPITRAGSMDLIDTVFYSESDRITPDEVKQALINHDGYDSNIVVKRARRSIKRS